jgi:hypothetical protein
MLPRNQIAGADGCLLLRQLVRGRNTIGPLSLTLLAFLQVKKMMSDHDKENTGFITKQQFVEIFRAKWGETEPPAMMHLAFQVPVGLSCRLAYI